MAQRAHWVVRSWSTPRPKAIRPVPRLAMDADGNAVVTWHSELQDGDGLGVFANQYAFEQTTGLGEFMVNTMTAGDQRAPDVAMTPTGEFVVTWEGLGTVEVEDSLEIFARRYANDATPLDMAEIQVNTATIRDQVSMRMWMWTTPVILSWRGLGKEFQGSGSDVFGQRMNADGTLADAEFRVNSTTMASQVAPDVGMSGSGEFAVTWQSVHQDGFSWGIFAHEYDAAGDTVPGKDEFQVNQWVMGPQNHVAYDVSPGGQGVFVWLGNDPDHRPAVHGKAYDLPGTTDPSTIEDMILANFVALEDTPASAFMDAAGQSVVVWESYGEDGDGLGVYAKRIGFDGETITEAFLVNTETTLAIKPIQPSLATQTDNTSSFGNRMIQVHPVTTFGRSDTMKMIFRSATPFWSTRQRSGINLTPLWRWRRMAVLLSFGRVPDEVAGRTRRVGNLCPAI